MKYSIISVVTAAGAIMLSAPALAQQGGMNGACRADIQQYCSKVQKGEGRIVGCLRANAASLSSSCQTALKSVKPKRRAGGRRDGKMRTALRGVCGGDVKAFCSTVKRGGGRIVRCLNQNAQVSDACRSTIREIVQARRNSR